MSTLAPLSQLAATLRNRYQAVRQLTLNMVAGLSAEDMMVQSCPEASPAKWHLAHTSWFFETFVLREFVRDYQPFDPDFAWLFNSYYNALGAMPAKKLRSSFSRPSLDRILAYRKAVDEAMLELLAGESAAGEMPDGNDDLVRRLVLGLEHEQQHLELIATDIKHAFFTNPLRPVFRTEEWEPRPAVAGGPRWSRFQGGLVEIGITPSSDRPEAFAFDNETPRHPVYLQPFEVADQLVSCAEFLEFVQDDGYRRPELWLSEGWTAVQQHAWEAPLFWEREAADTTGWSVFTAYGARPLSAMLGTPVCHVSFFEADAFARWAGCRLPTEFEWEHAVMETGEATLLQAGHLLEDGGLHPQAAAASDGLGQMFGDVWEWTQSPYTGYPGYAPLPGALGEYNGKFMSSQMILRGGSCATPRSHLRATYRNFFGPATRWQFSGLRLARTVAGSAA